MPRYDYVCSTCNHADEEIFPMREFADLRTCPVCLNDSYRLQVNRLVHTDIKPFFTPIEMHSIGCNSWDEIRQLQRAGITVIDDPKNDLFGVPIAHNRKEKLTALKTVGYVEKT